MLHSIFYDAEENIKIFARNVSAVCQGDYIYTLSERSINDTWHLTITDTNLMVEVGLRVKSENFN